MHRTDPYDQNPFLLSGTWENVALSALAAREDQEQVDISETAISLSDSCMFKLILAQYDHERKRNEDIAMLDLCARMYLAGVESVRIAQI